MTAAPETRQVGVADGVRLTVDVWPGAAPAFVLVHGLASNALMWHGAAARLAALGHAVATVDQRGHGRSDKPDAGYDLATAVADLRSLIAALAADDPAFARPVAAGQSWGASVTLELGWLHPDEVAGVVCVDGGTMQLSDPFPEWEDCAAALAPPRLAGIPFVELEARIRQMHAGWPPSGIAGTLANFEVRPDGTAAPWLTFDRHMLLLRALWEFRPTTRYAGMKVPVVLVPADDPGFPNREGKQQAVAAAADAIPRCAVHWFSPSHHDVHAEHPDRLAEVLHAEVDSGVLAG